MTSLASRTTRIARLRDAVGAALHGAQNSDGGWGPEPGRASCTEATALAVLAMARLAEEHGVRARRGAAWLNRLQSNDGSWPIRSDVPGASWATPLAILALQAVGGDTDRIRRGLDWLVRTEPHRYTWIEGFWYRWAPASAPVRLDPTLRGWSWVLGTASWVEPTAYAVIALKRAGRMRPRGAAERIRDAELLLVDRMCQGGGWNYGNSVVYGARLAPFADTTALALLALYDRRDPTVIHPSLDTLERLVEHQRSGMALGWAILSFAAHGRDTSRLVVRLAESYERTRFLEHVKSAALAALALGEGAGLFTGGA